jgi:peptide/nickel transport system permease protein
MRVTIVTLDNHLTGAVGRVRSQLAREAPGLELTVHAASNWAASPDSLRACIEDIGQANIVIATEIINLPFYIRVARAEANVRRSAGFVESARLAGNSEWGVLMRHVFPNLLPPIAVQVSLNMGWAILNAAGLSFIGLGVRPPQPEWGIMVAEGASYMISGEWWVSFFPGVVLMLAVFCFNLLGDGLRDMIDPRRRT